MFDALGAMWYEIGAAVLLLSGVLLSNFARPRRP